MLTESHADVMAEVMNLGMGHAASSLNELIGSHIALSVPEQLQQVHWSSIAAVHIGFDGLLKGNMALIFPAESARTLARLLTGDPLQDDDASRKMAIEETGNILLNGVIGAFSNLVEDEVSFSIPCYTENPALIARLMEDGTATLSRFAVPEHQMEGEILVYLEVQSADRLLRALAAH